MIGAESRPIGDRGGWNEDKVAAFREAFFEFLSNVHFNSKELGGNAILGANIYRAQMMFFDGVFSALENDIHDLYFLKSRQLGISTASRALSVFWLGMHDGLQGAFVFDTAFNVARARREIKTMIESLPKSVKFPRVYSDNRDAIVLENGSELMFMAAGVKDARSGGGLGRSTGLNFSHSSEISSWASEEGLVSFRQSLSNSYPDRLFIWESTARGYNLWYNLWDEAKQDEYNKRCIFIGWWARDDQEFSRGTENFERYGREPARRTEIARIRLVKELYGWEITLGQLAWYRWKTDPNRARDEGDPEDSYLLSEQPWVESEAFQQSGSAFFQTDVLSQRSRDIVSAAPRPQCFKFWPGIDFTSCQIHQSKNRREIELQVWEEPCSESDYIVAADPAFGHNEKNNNSAAQVVRCYADAMEQVAEYANATIAPHQFAWLLWTLIGYYGSKPNSRVFFIVELNGPGEEVWRQYQTIPRIVRDGYLRRAAQDKGIADIFGNVRNYIYQRSDSMNTGHAWHFKTNQQLKVQIMEACRNYLQNDTLILRSMNAIEEMKTITRDGDKIAAEGSDRDDRTFALAMATRMWDDRVRRALIAGNRTREAEKARLAGSIQDQAELFARNTLQNFFAQRRATRLMHQRQQMQPAWRSAPRPNLGQRRF